MFKFPDFPVYHNPSPYISSIYATSYVPAKPKRKNFVKDLGLQDCTKEYQKFIFKKAKELAVEFSDSPSYDDILYAGAKVLDIIESYEEFE